MAPSTQPTKPSTSAAHTHDINTLLNRTSVALARSQRLVDSWIPAATPTSPSSTTASQPQTTTKTTTTSTNPTSTTNDADADAALASLLAEVGRSETAGLGFIDPTANSNGASSGSRASGAGESELDKLRRQMLGRKGAAAAQAKEREKARSGVGSRAQVLGVGVGRDGLRDGKGIGLGMGKRRADSESEDSGDEGGRAAAVGRKKVRTMVKGQGGVPVRTAVMKNEPEKNGEHAAAHGGVRVADLQKQQGETNAHKDKNKKVDGEEAEGEDEDAEGAKGTISRKPTSYLDEILLKRDKKKKKKKKNKHNGAEQGAISAAGI